MKLTRNKSRTVNGVEYFKHLFVIPNTLIEALGWSQELEYSVGTVSVNDSIVLQIQVKI